MDLPLATGFGGSTPLSSPRAGQRYKTTSAVTLPEAHGFKPMDVTLKLRSAVYFADITKARLAILAGGDVNAANPENHGETMLHTAALEGTLDIAQLLLENKANVNKTNDCGESALHLACFEANDSMARLLVSFGADVDLEDEEGNTPYDVINLIRSPDEPDAGAPMQQQLRLKDAVTPRKLLQQQQQEEAGPSPAASPARHRSANPADRRFMRLRIGRGGSIPKEGSAAAAAAAGGGGGRGSPALNRVNSLDAMQPMPSPTAGGGGGGGGGGRAARPTGVRTPIRERMRAAKEAEAKRAADAAANEPLPIEVDLIWTMIRDLSDEHRAILRRRLNATE